MSPVGLYLPYLMGGARAEEDGLGLLYAREVAGIDGPPIFRASYPRRQIPGTGAL